MSHFRSCLMFAVLVATSSQAFAQYKVDRRDHSVRDEYGTVIGRYNQDFIEDNYKYVLPHYDDSHTGTYWQRDGKYYYRPQTSTRFRQPSQTEELRFGGRGHMDDLSERLEAMVNETCLDMHYNYSHNRDYKQTYADAYKILEDAKWIHNRSNYSNNGEMRRRLMRMDDQIHEVEGDVRGWRSSNRRDYGEVSLNSRLRLIEATIHHLMYDAGIDPDRAHDDDRRDNNGRGNDGRGPGNNPPGHNNAPGHNGPGNNGPGYNNGPGRGPGRN